MKNNLIDTIDEAKQNELDKRAEMINNFNKKHPKGHVFMKDNIGDMDSRMNSLNKTLKGYSDGHIPSGDDDFSGIGTTASVASIGDSSSVAGGGEGASSGDGGGMGESYDDDFGFGSFLYEAAEEDTTLSKEQVKNVLNAIPKSDKTAWAETASEFVNNIPDDTYATLWDTIKTRAGSLFVNDKQKSDIEGASGEKVEGTTIKDILSVLDSKKFIEEHPEKVKPTLLAVMTVIALIEPTPIGEIITAILAVLPSDVVATIVKVLVSLDPVSAFIHKLTSK